MGVIELKFSNWQNHRNSGFVEKKWTALVKMCFYCFMPRFMYADITCACIFSSSTHKRPANLFVIGGAFLFGARRLSVVWNSEVVRYSGAVNVLSLWK